jgi:hypothetical protein
LAEEAVAILTNALGQQHPEVADALAQRAAVERLLNQPDRAAAAEQQAQRILTPALR